MTEEKNSLNRQDDDFKYVMMDMGNLYLGARFTFGELLSQEMIPFKFKTILTHYLLKEADSDTSLESQFYYLEKDTFLYDTFVQLKVRVRVSIQEEKKTFAGQRKLRYGERLLTLKELTDMNLARKKASGMIIREIVISKLGLMTFSV